MRQPDRTTIIGLMGYAQSGKDTVAEVLNEFGYKRLAFADILRECLYALDPIVGLGNMNSHQQPHFFRISELVDARGWESAKQIPEVRGLLQRVGTEVGRGLLGENIWVDTVFRKMLDGGQYVITDVRFPNEAQAIKAIPGTLWRITRPGVGPRNGHASENSLETEEADATISNVFRTVEDFQASLRANMFTLLESPNPRLVDERN